MHEQNPSKRPRDPMSRPMRKILSDLAILVTVCILIMFAIKECSGQNTGGNGAGFFENIDDTTIAQINNFNQPITLRIPGGAIAKFADPYTTGSGWGLTHDGVDSIQLKYGSSEEEAQADALSKWHNRVTEQPINDSYLDHVIELSTQVDLSVIWVANIFIPAENTVNTLAYLTSAGVNVVAVEMGNETYSQLDYDFEKYISLTTPIYNAIKTEFPTLPISHISAPLCKGRAEQENWNNALKAHLKPGDWVTEHYYLGSREITSMNGLPDRKTVNYNAPSDDLSDVFSAIYDQLLSYDHCALTGAQELYAGTTLIITETNTQPSEPLGDTYLNALYQFQFLNEHRTQYKYICWHNFASPDVYGMFSRLKKGETGLTMKPRTTSYSFDIAGDIPAGSPEISSGQTVTISTTGAHWYYYVNGKGSNYTVPVVVAGVTLDSVRQRFFTAPFLSSNQITTGSTFDAVVPANSAGYIVFYTSPEQVSGCTDPTASNYNPAATINDGSCVYPPPPPPPCNKPRWCSSWTRFFKSSTERKKCNC